VFPPSEEEKQRLAEGLATAYRIPFIDDVEDYVFEAILCHMKRLSLVDTIEVGRNKLLFDVVAPDGRGWSAKTLMVAPGVITPGGRFELVIQRASIFGKAAALGFPDGLSLESPVENLGKALIEHWNQKFNADSIEQKVTDPRIAILLKDRTRRNFGFLEARYPPFEANNYRWAWSKGAGKGLQGSDDEGLCFKWYPNQAQFFEVFTVPADAAFFEVRWSRLTMDELIARVS
jgi:hypothetical protein